MLLVEKNHGIYFSQSQLLLAKTDEDRITNRKAVKAVFLREDHVSINDELGSNFDN